MEIPEHLKTAAALLAASAEKQAQQSKDRVKLFYDIYDSSYQRMFSINARRRGLQYAMLRRPDTAPAIYEQCVYMSLAPINMLADLINKGTME